MMQSGWLQADHILPTSPGNSDIIRTSANLPIMRIILLNHIIYEIKEIIFFGVYECTKNEDIS